MRVHPPVTHSTFQKVSVKTHSPTNHLFVISQCLEIQRAICIKKLFEAAPFESRMKDKALNTSIIWDLLWSGDESDLLAA